MNNKQKIIAGLILFLSVFLRLHNYAVYPQRGATSDEYTYAFLGTSLLTEGVPISWSAFQAYPKVEDVFIQGIHFPIVSPYFDHPPLYAILVGGFSILFGQSSFQLIDLQTIRIVPIILATLASVLVFLVTQRLYGFKTALFALLIYSTTTIFVMNQRVSVSENLLTVLFLTAVYIYSKAQRKLTRRHIVVLGILAGLALLTKIMGIALFLSLLFLLIRDRTQKSSIAVFCVVFALVGSALLIYAGVYNWQLFWQIQGLQSGRNIGPETLLMLITQPVIVNKVYVDGWYFLGLLALGFLAQDYKKHAVIVVPAAIYFLLLLSSLTHEGQSGWYMIPEFAFMAIATAVFVTETLKQKNLVFLLLPLFVGLYQIQSLFEPAFGLAPQVYRLLLALLFIPLLLLFFLKKENAYARLGGVWFYLFIVGNIFLTYTYVHPS